MSTPVVPAVPTDDPTLRTLDTVIAQARQSQMWALRVKGDTFDHAGLHDGDIAIVRRQSDIDIDGDRYVVGDFEAAPFGVLVPITTAYFLRRLDDGLIEARDAEGHLRRCAPESSFDIQGRVIAVIERI